MLGTAIGALIANWMLQHLSIAHILLLGSGIVVTLYMVYEIIKSQGSERIKLIVALVLMLEAVIFFNIAEAI